jgi:hypothetical protein
MLSPEARAVPFPEHAPDIHAMVNLLVADDLHHISFAVGKLGRVDRFVLCKGNPGHPPIEILDLSTEPEDGTAAVLQILDDLVDTDPTFGVMYNNPRDTRYAYCLWQRMLDRKERETKAKILPIYRSRMLERRRICNGELKRGHRDFGFFPLEGYG